jgi:hypothetical protein
MSLKGRVRHFISARFAEANAFRTFVDDHFDEAIPAVPWQTGLENEVGRFVRWVAEKKRVPELWLALKEDRPEYTDEINELEAAWKAAGSKFPVEIPIISVGAVFSAVSVLALLAVGVGLYMWLKPDRTTPGVRIDAHLQEKVDDVHVPTDVATDVPTDVSIPDVAIPDVSDPRVKLCYYVGNQATRSCRTIPKSDSCPAHCIPSPPGLRTTQPPAECVGKAICLCAQVPTCGS